jgi:hypothetical protein
MNINSALAFNKLKQRVLDRSISDIIGLSRRQLFWNPITSRWLVWFGCSWAVGSVLVFAPLISKAVKALFQ